MRGELNGDQVLHIQKLKEGTSLSQCLTRYRGSGRGSAFPTLANLVYFRFRHIRKVS